MSQQFRLILKAVALGRYLLAKNRIDKISGAAKDLVAGTNSVGDVAKEIFPISKETLQESFKIKRLRKRARIYGGCLLLAGFISYEYYSHESYVPITNRRHFVIIPRSVELNYQETFKNLLVEQFEEDDCRVLDETHPYYHFVTPILDRLKEACVYFSPECQEYMNHMRLLVVESDEINAFSAMGSIIVINTGLIKYFEELKEQGQNIDVEECVADVIAHELSHSLSRHPVEAMLRWTGWAYYIYITIVPDLILMPIVKGLFDKKASRSQEHEADFEALYLLKRSGYDPSSMIKTLSLLPETEDDYEIVSLAKEQVEDHPRIRTRVAYLQDRIFGFERDFSNRYTVISKDEPKHDSFLSSILKLFSF